MIDFSQVTLIRDGQPVLHDLSLHLTQRRIGVIGANGSGKSSFARLLNGLLLPSGGHVTIDGLDTRRDTAAVRRKVGFIFQNPDTQIVMPLVGEDIAFGLKRLKLSKADLAARIAGVLSRFGLEGFQDRACHSLSGGEKQMLAIAAVMVLEPDLLVLDEPTALLDLRNRNRLIATLDALTQPLVMVSHDLDLLNDFQRVLVIDRGRLVCDDTPAGAIGFYRRHMA